MFSSSSYEFFCQSQGMSEFTWDSSPIYNSDGWFTNSVNMCNNNQYHSNSTIEEFQAHPTSHPLSTPMSAHPMSAPVPMSVPPPPPAHLTTLPSLSATSFPQFTPPLFQQTHTTSSNPSGSGRTPNAFPFGDIRDNHQYFPQQAQSSVPFPATTPIHSCVFNQRSVNNSQSNYTFPESISSSLQANFSTLICSDVCEIY